MTTVYHRPNCVQCNLTFKELNKRGVAYEHIDVSQDEAAADKVRALGHLQAPVVITETGDNWSGFRIDKINHHFGKAA